jgi:hypothetical protein
MTFNPTQLSKGFMLPPRTGFTEETSAAEPPQWPVLEAEAHRGFAGEIVATAIANSEADPVAVLATLLTHAGICVGRGPAVRVGDDYHHARLFSVLVGQSARGRKGTSEKPIKRLAAHVSERLGQLAWVPGPLSTGEGLAYAIRDGDGTEDGDPGVSDKRLLVVEGEFGAALRAMQRQGNTLSTALRCAWDGSTIAPLTKTNRTVATDPHVGIVAHITQAELKELLTRVDIFNGFANRFQWFCVRRSKAMPLATGMSDSDVRRLGNEYADRLAMARELRVVEFSVDARSMYGELYEEMTAETGGLHGIITARAEAQIIRLALTYAVLDASTIITTDHLTSGLAVWDYCNASSRYLFGQIGTSPVERRILKALELQPMTTTELHRALDNHVASHALRTALENLQGQGRIDQQKQGTTGRPRVTWYLRASFGNTSGSAENANFAN